MLSGSGADVPLPPRLRELHMRHVDRFHAIYQWIAHAHVVEDQQVGLEVPPEDAIVTLEGFIVREVTDAVEDTAVVNGVAEADATQPPLARHATGTNRLATRRSLHA